MSTIETRLGNLRRSGIFTTSSSNQLGFLDSSDSISLNAEDAAFSFGGSGAGTASRITPDVVKVATARAHQQQQQPHGEEDLQAKYRSLKRQYAILDAASRASVTEKDNALKEVKGLKYELVKARQAKQLVETEAAQLRSQIVAVHETMTELAAQAKRDREEAVAEARREERERALKRPTPSADGRE